MKKPIEIIPELVAPAGDWPSLESAVKAGADAVYFGLRNLSMRQTAPNFDILEIKKVMALLHKHKRKGYLTLNTIIYERDLEKLDVMLLEAKKAKVDAVICWDMAVLSKAFEAGLPVHLSTQASVSNFISLKFFCSFGVKRIVLARECSLEDIKQIAQKIKREKIDCKLEAFVHGSMCVSVSGRCFFSHDLFGKSANRGECVQPCRREFLIKDIELGNEYVLGSDYIMSAQDLCMIEHINKLVSAGVSAFKIEGRMRTPEYVSVVTSVYRKAIDAYKKGLLTDALQVSLKKKLSSVYNRGFSEGFYFSPPKISGLSGGKSSFEKIFVGQVEKFYKKINVAQLVIRNDELKKGDKILVSGKTTPAMTAVVGQIQIQHKPVRIARRGQTTGIKLPFSLRPKDKIFLLKSNTKKGLSLG
ncbi:MAG: U32 family peptidase [Candidatus Omnitrophica bacterium]|nr:U32 family peptidase [Candidatus Omnitrophota bacterium]